MGSAEENGQSSNGQISRENPEAKSIDYHGCELPIICLLGAFVVVLHLPRYEPDLVEDSEDLVSDPEQTILLR